MHTENLLPTSKTNKKKRCFLNFISNKFPSFLSYFFFIFSFFFLPRENQGSSNILPKAFFPSKILEWKTLAAKRTWQYWNFLKQGFAYLSWQLATECDKWEFSLQAAGCQSWVILFLAVRADHRKNREANRPEIEGKDNRRKKRGGKSPTTKKAIRWWTHSYSWCFI